MKTNTRRCIKITVAFVLLLAVVQSSFSHGSSTIVPGDDIGVAIQSDWVESDDD